MRLKLDLARLALFWERLWPALWPAVAVIGCFAVLALYDLLPTLPPLAHLLVLALLAGGAAVLFGRAVLRLKWPDRTAARRRLERESGLDHRPLETLEDALPAGLGDRATADLWRLHQRRMADRIRGLRVGRARAGLARVDSHALRALIGLVALVGLVHAWGDIGGRLWRAVTPNAAALAGPPPSLVLWMTPPVYTGLAPVTLDPAAAPAEPIPVPTGSAVLAQVEGGRAVPELAIGAEATPFETVGERVYKATSVILAGERLAVRQGRHTLGDWPIRVVADSPPLVEFREPPAPSERGALRLAFKASDDYGLTQIGAELRRSDGLPAPDGAAAVTLSLPLPSLHPRSAEAATFQDLTPHPWAGLKVKMRLVARDAAEQTGRSAEVELVLPERTFRHPIARAIIAERKRLVEKPGERLPVVRALGVIGQRHELFQSDSVAILALRSAQHRLIDDRSPRAVKEVVDLLWDTALGIEEGEAAVAERELRAAQEALAEALARNAPDEEIERLMDELERALDRFLEALAERLQQQLREGADLPPLDPDTQTVRPEELKELIDRARELARSGAREAARDLLAQLQEMLENLQAGMMGEPQEGSDQAMQMMHELDELTRLQQQLLDRSFRRSQQNDPQNGDPGDAQRQTLENSVDAAAQEALRRRLGELMRELGELSGEIPRPLGEAERSMKGAVQDLEGGQPGSAAEAQGDALDALQRSRRAMAEQFQRQYGRMPGMGRQQPLDRFGNQRDPFGRTRPQGNFEDTGDVEIPDKSDIQRAREILDELRRRAGERTRPATELDYIERLLRRF